MDSNKQTNKQTKGLKSRTATYRINRLAHRVWDLKMNRSRVTLVLPVRGVQKDRV